jgi:hypothetical protein
LLEIRLTHAAQKEEEEKRLTPCQLKILYWIRLIKVDL